MSRLADQDARDLATEVFDRPVVLEAGAGTGKTRALVSRIGSWLLGPGWRRAEEELANERRARMGPPAELAEVAERAADRVAAITFTEAAAAEMARRVSRLLAQAATESSIQDLERLPAGLSLATAAQRAAALLAAAGRLRISTIHGFCHRLLAEHPLEAGLHPAFRVDADGELLKEIATRVVLRRLREGEPNLVALLAAGVDPPELLEALSALAARGLEAYDLDAAPYSVEEIGEIVGETTGAIDSLLAAAAPLSAGRRVRTIEEGLEALRTLRERLAGASQTPEGLTALAPDLEAAASAARKILGDWAKGRFGKAEQAALGEGTSALAERAAVLSRVRDDLAALDPAAFARARDALRPLLDELRGRLRAEGVLSFDDLLVRAARLLAERASVRRRVRRGMHQLLVDEFQDTDERQCDLLRQLTLRDPHEARPGLFLVGDPKQSIYGWRSADLASYVGFLDELAREGARFGRLAVNFRSAPPILAEVERALSPVLREEPGIQAPFEPLLPCPEKSEHRGFVALARAPVEYWLSADRERIADGERTAAPRAAELEARAIAAEIRALVDAGEASYGGFALLLRARGDLDTYLDALRRAEVPYVVERDRSFYRRREVIDAAAAVRALLDPGDLLALVAFLRSPFVGVPDAAWIPLWRAGFAAAMIDLDGERGLDEALTAVRGGAADLPPGVPGLDRISGWEQALADAVVSIAALRVSARTAPPALWIEELRTRFLFEPIAAARFLGRFGLANLQRFFSELELRLAGRADPGHVLAALRTAVAEESAAEEARPPDALDDAVAIQTVHTAKGLQFEQVYLVQAHRRGRGRGGARPPLVDAERRSGRLEMVLLHQPTPGWRHVRLRRQRVAAAESARLLYVAMTRAIDRLVICGQWSQVGDAASLLDTAAPSFAQLLARRIAAAPTPDLDRPALDEASGVRWKLVDEATSTSAATSRPEAGETSADELLARGAERSERRHAARSRSMRARIAAASALAPAPSRTPPLDPERRYEAPRDRALARALGLALHRALEIAPRAAGDASAWRAEVVAHFRGERPGATGSEIGQLEEALARLRSGALWARLEALALHVVARELPIAIAASPGEPEGPLAGVVGTLDLLYRDPDSGDLVVVDFKSDAFASDADLERTIERYRPQLAAYGRAVRETLSAPAPPRLELWLLALDRVAEIPRQDTDPARTG